MKEKITAYLRKQLGNDYIAKQYVSSPLEQEEDAYNDPLLEDSHEVVKGLVHKYKNRALIKVSYQCAAHCRFCTRIRQIGRPEGTLKGADILNIVNYLREHPEIEDVILSGGDPLVTPKITAELLRQIRPINSVKVIRIGSRLALQAPAALKSRPLLRLLEDIDAISREKPFYILLHVEHPDELTPEAIAAIQSIRQKTQAILLSQTVFLKGINIDFDTLHRLFRQLYFVGVTPYYLYHCDKVKGLERFMGDIEKEKAIVKKLRKELSGIACPLFIIDPENGYGKRQVDLGA